MRRGMLLAILIVSLVGVMVLASAPNDSFVLGKELFQTVGKYGGTFTLRLSSEPQSFNYYGTLSSAAYTIDGLLFSPLVQLNPITKKIEPALAKSWEISEDGKEITFHLRHVTWSDGVPLTADDVTFTMNYVLMNPHALGNEVARFTINGKPIKWEKVDDYTVKAILPAPYGAFFMVLTPALIMPKHALSQYLPEFNPKVTDPSAFNKAWGVDTNPSKIPSTGPFVLEKYVTGQKVVLERNPNFWEKDPWGNQLPYVDKVVFLIVKNAETALAMFESGQIDWLSITPSDFPYLKQKELNGAHFTVLNAKSLNPTPSPLHLTFNFDVKDPDLHSLFNNLSFREAMEYALDRQRIVNEVYNTLASPRVGPVLPGTYWYDPKVEKIARKFDLKTASAILDSLGLKMGPDGIRRFPDGKKVEFSLLTRNNPPTYSGIYMILQEDLKKIGIKLDVQPLDVSIAYQKALAGNFEAALLAFGDQPDPQLRKAIWQPGNPLYYNHLSTMDKKTHAPIFKNMEWWEKAIWNDFEKGQANMDQAVRKEYYDEWQEAYETMLPFIYICKGNSLMVVSKKVGNFFKNDKGIIVGSELTAFLK
jgi:peptide/nickel transport system substrate-binding protein